MSLDRAEYFKNRLRGLQNQAEFQRKQIEDAQNGLEVTEAEIFAVKIALERETQDALNALDDPPEKALEDEINAEAETASSSAIGDEVLQTSHAQVVRRVLQQHPGGLTPARIFAELTAVGHQIRKEYFYSLLSRMVARGELRRLGGNYYLDGNAPAR